MMELQECRIEMYGEKFWGTAMAEFNQRLSKVSADTL